MSLPLYTTQALRNIEADAARALPPGTLMQRAGDAAARYAVRRFPAAARIVVLCGPGNNGGDGYACASALRALGRQALCVALAPASTEDARRARDRWQQAGGRCADELPIGERFDLAIDALFGIGLGRPLAGAFAEAVRWMAEACDAVLALDVPSGLDADRGCWVGLQPGVRADTTISFLGGKPGLFTGDGVDGAGEVVIDTLGVDTALSAGALASPQSFPTVARPRRRNTHKGSFGSVQVVGGAAGMQGAALLAARAALRLGSGRVYVDMLAPAVEGALTVDPLAPELMFRQLDPAAAVQVVGCGLGQGEVARARVQRCLAGALPAVLDADALNLVAADAGLRAALVASSSPRVLTPHPLEAARLLGTTAGEVQADRVGAACTLACDLKSWVVLKGAGSVIAAPGDQSRWWINPTGNAALATAGSGDVLAGMLGALLAQGYEAMEVVLAGPWLHGRAAEDGGQDIGLIAGDLPQLAARALARLRTEASPRRD